MAKKSDYAHEFDPNFKEPSARFKAAMKKEAIEARKRIIERGLVQFRADKKLMKALYDVAEKSHVAVGVLCRDVIWSYLENQTGLITKENAKKTKQLQSYESPSGLTGKVSEDSNAEQLIDEAIETLKVAKKKLKNR